MYLASPPLFNRGELPLVDGPKVNQLTFLIVALQEYVLIAAQKEAGGSGGLRDKPTK